MSVNICSIGDIMLGENMHHYGRGIPTCFRGNYPSLIPKAVSEIVNQADVLIGNLECSLMPDNEHVNAPPSRAIYSAPESSLSCFDNWKPLLIFNVANNHFGQHGKKAMDYTVRCLKERNFYYIGRAPTPLKLTVNGKSICFWGVTIVKDECTDDGYLKSTAENLLSDLDWGDKPTGTFWILSIHWGVEYLTLPSKTQQKLAEALAKRGVDLILGHHPHVIQPVRYVRGVPVAYSQGNFLFDQNFSKLTQTGLMICAELCSATDVRIYKLQSRNYQIISSLGISAEQLEIFCEQNMSRLRPLIMRFLMKIELLSKAHKVPMIVWVHFFFSFLMKISKILQKLTLGKRST